MILKGFENYDINKLFYHYLTTLNLNNKNKKKWHYLGHEITRLIFKICFSKTQLDIRKSGVNNPIIYLDRELKYRKDIKDMVDRVLGTIRDAQYDNIGWSKKIKFSVSRTFNSIKNISAWIPQLNKSDYSLREKTSIFNLLLDFEDIKKDLELILANKHYKLCVVFYDAESIQNFISQYMKLHGISTATLQHGIMLSPRPGVHDNIDFSGIEFKSFVSDYFLAWNEFTKNEAVKTGIAPERINVVGVAKCIGKDIIKSKKTNVIGLILDGRFEDENNIPMIKLTTKYASENGYEVIMRYHPYYNGDEFSEYCNETVVVSPKKSTLEEFLNDVTFCVLANSTVLFELEYYNVPFIRFSMGNEKDKFKDYCSNPFSDYEGITKCVQSMKDNIASPNMKVETFNNYSNFFSKFLN